MFIVMRKLNPNAPVQYLDHVFSDKYDAIEIIEAMGIPEWDAEKNTAVFSDGSFYSIQEHDPLTRH